MPAYLDTGGATAPTASKSSSAGTADYSSLVVPSTAAPGLLGSIGITSRGLRDALTVAVGVGMCIVGLIAIFESTKVGTTVTKVAGKVAEVVA